MGLRWPALAFVGRCGPSLTCVGLRWLLLAVVGRCGPLLTCVLPFVGLRWPSLALIGYCGPSLTCVGLRWPSLVSVCHSGSADSFLCMSIFIFRLWLKTVQILKIRFEHMT